MLCHGYVPATRCQVNARRVQTWKGGVFRGDVTAKGGFIQKKKRDFSDKNGGIVVV